MEESITFPCQDSTLLGILHLPDGPQRHLGIVVVVGGPQTRVGSHRQFVLMARAFAGAGYPVLRFDYRGMGDSDGEVRTFEQVDDDVRAAIDAICKECPALQGIVLFGLCDAASALLMHCIGDRRLAGLILANPWVRTAESEARSYVRHYYGQRLLQASFWRKLMSGEVELARSVVDFLNSIVTAFNRRRRNTSRPQAVFRDRMLNGLEACQQRVLILVSERDLVAQEFVDLCRDADPWRAASNRVNVTTAGLLGVDHTFSTPGSLTIVTNRCVAWLESIDRRPGCAR